MRALVMMLLVLGLPAFGLAQFGYTNNNGTITIIAYGGSGGDVIIPSMIDGLTVTGIGGGVFYFDTNVTGVVIPAGVTNIGDFAFYNTGLTSVYIGPNVTSIGDEAFTSCNSLATIDVDTNNPAYSSVDGVLFDKTQTTLIQYPAGNAGISYEMMPNSVTSIGEDAFNYCTNLISITIPNSVTDIGLDAFYYCTSLADITVPNSVINIEDYAFSYCWDLTKVTIGTNVTSIGDGAFSACFNLPSVTVPASVTNIGDGAFGTCFSLTAITVDAQNAFYSSRDGVLFDKSQSTLIDYPGPVVGSYTIPYGVTTIADGAFGRNYSLTNVTIPSSVSTVGYGAFLLCMDLTSVYFEGNAPATYSDGFNRRVTVYCLPGTGGWDDFSLSAGLSITAWLLPNPVILTNGPSFGVQTNKFGFIISWATNASVVVEASANLAYPVWSPVATNTLTGGSFYFSEPLQTNNPGLYYRLSWP